MGLIAKIWIIFGFAPIFYELSGSVARHYKVEKVLMRICLGKFDFEQHGFGKPFFMDLVLALY